MNLFEIFSLNKHGRHREVLFSSALSFLLSKQSGNFATWFGKELLSASGIDTHELYNGMDSFPEQSLDQNLDELISENPLVRRLNKVGSRSGNIDNLVIFKCKQTQRTLKLGLEIKIHDSSSDRGEISDAPQLIRYANALRACGEDWVLAFLVPSERSDQCHEAFRQLRSHLATYGQENKAVILYWHHAKGNIVGANSSLFEILQKARRVKEETWDKLVQQILDDLTTFIESDPLFNRETDEDAFYPTREELEQLQNPYGLAQMFRYYARVGTIQPGHTSIGISFGKGDQKNQFHGNAVYRVRTTQKYKCSPGERLPKVLGIEVWLDLEPQFSDGLSELNKKYGIELQIRNDWHLNANYDLRSEPIRLLEIDPGELPSNLQGDPQPLLEDIDAVLRAAYKLNAPI